MLEEGVHMEKDKDPGEARRTQRNQQDREEEQEGTVGRVISSEDPRVISSEDPGEARRTQRNQQDREEEQEARAPQEEQEARAAGIRMPLTNQQRRTLLEQYQEEPTDEQKRDLLTLFQEDDIARLRRNQGALQEEITRLGRNQEALQEAIRAQGEPQNTVSLDADAYVTAKTLAEYKCTSIPQLLRKAVTTQRWFDDVQAAAGTRLLVEKGGKLREVRDITEKQPQQPEAQ